MIISAASRGRSSIYGAAGRILSPIAGDVVMTLALRYLFPRVTPRIRWAISLLPAFGALVLTSGISKFSMIVGLCYVACKVCLYLWVVKFPKQNYVNFGPNGRFCLSWKAPDPSHDLRALALERRNTIREIFHNPETLQLVDQGIEKGAQDLRSLYQELEIAASRVRKEDRFNKMAIDLTMEGGPNLWQRFSCIHSLTLFDLYRMMRGLKIIVNGQTNVEVFFLLQIENEQQQLEDSQPFFAPPSHQSRWRETYNQIIDIYAPIMEELKKIPSDQQSEIQKSFLKMAVRDDAIMVAKDDDPNPQAFKLKPCGPLIPTFQSDEEQWF